MSCIVLKFGSSILSDESALPLAVHEVYRHVRAGRKVVAVVSALAGETDRLLAKAGSFGERPDALALAGLVATGEAHAAALLTLALDRAGISAAGVDPGTLRLLTQGHVLDSQPISIHTSAIERLLEERPVLVTQGFIGRDHLGRTTLLGRGGSDLSALYIAGALRCPCVLLKDVDAIYDADPAVHAGARRLTRASYEDVLALPEGIVQHKAVAFAQRNDVPVHVGAIGREAGTVIAHHATVTNGRMDEAGGRRLRVALLGLGTVGGGVLEHLRRLRDFEIIGASVRDSRRHAHAGVRLVDDPVALAREASDIVVETLGGLEPARRAIIAALERGASVVTANKAVVARYGAEFADAGARGGGRLLCGAAVGGAVPVLEVLGGLRDRVVRIDAVINGTTNFVLDRLAEGTAFADAVTLAQRAGFAEADPSADLDGVDAANKLALIAQRALGQPLAVEQIARTGIRGVEPDQVQRAVREGRAVRLVASLWWEGGRDEGTIAASIEPRTLDATHALAQARDEHNCVVAELDDGSRVTLRGRGAGRWPTAEAVMGDVLEVLRLHDARAHEAADTGVAGASAGGAR